MGLEHLDAMNVEQVARYIGVSARTMERRATFDPPFPAPIRRKPLAWHPEEVRDWRDRANLLAQRRARGRAA